MVWGCNCGKIPSIPFVWKRLNLLPEDYFQNVLCYVGRSVWHKIPLPYHCRKDFPQFVFLSFFSFFNSWFDFVFSSHDFVDIKAKLSSTRRAWKRCFLQSKSWDKVRQLLSLHCKPNFGSFSTPFRYIILQLPEHSSNFSFSLIFLIMLGEFLIWLRRC